MISFDYLPATLRLPGTYLEFAPGARGPLDIDQRLLLIGQKTAAGTATAEEPVLLTHPDQADEYFGVGSQLARMFRAAYENNSYTETWGLPLDDSDAGVAATGAILFGGALTKAGTLNFYVGGEKVAIAVASDDTPAEVSAALVAAINADTSLPVTAAVNGTTAEQVDVTAKNKGILGNGIDLRHSYNVQEALPAGLTATITAMSNGDGNPAITDALAAIGGLSYDYFCMPYTDSANLILLRDELESRWGWQVQTYGHGFSAARGTPAELQALGNSLNSQHLSIIGAGKSPSTPEAWAAAAAAIAAYYLNQDPARPLQTLELKGSSGAGPHRCDDRHRTGSPAARRHQHLLPRFGLRGPDRGHDHHLPGERLRGAGHGVSLRQHALHPELCVPEPGGLSDQQVPQAQTGRRWRAHPSGGHAHRHPGAGEGRGHRVPYQALRGKGRGGAPLALRRPDRGRARQLRPEPGQHPAAGAAHRPA